MNLLVISDAPILDRNGSRQAYAPYVREMDMWMRHVAQTTFFCPEVYHKPLLTTAFKNQKFEQYSALRLEFDTFVSGFKSVFSIPYQVAMLFYLMIKADHIHMRAPGNLTLLACFVQIFFPLKAKTAKYAGNWDPKASQPLSYKLQKRILSNAVLTRNVQVLAYGNWPDQSQNIHSFFTATYSETQRKKTKKHLTQPIKFLFVGTLTANKNPQLLIELVRRLNHQGIPSEAHFHGDGAMMQELIAQCQSEPVEDGFNTTDISKVNIKSSTSNGLKSSPTTNKLDNHSSEYIIQNTQGSSAINSKFKFFGNQPSDVVKHAYENAHFVVLASQSEGWPKVVAEGMWHGCVPIATAVSCVPWMLNGDWEKEGSSAFARRAEPVEVKAEYSRGILHHSVEETCEKIEWLLENPDVFTTIAANAQSWSQQYTLERFEQAIQELLKKN